MGGGRRNGSRHGSGEKEEDTSMVELKAHLNNTKKRTAPGPDGVQMEAFQMMNETNLETLGGIRNDWIRKEEWP